MGKRKSSRYFYLIRQPLQRLPVQNRLEQSSNRKIILKISHYINPETFRDFFIQMDLDFNNKNRRFFK